MNRILVFATIALFMTSPLTAANGASVAGMYVEARTAEVFVGGCLMGSEAETTGRQAVLAWKIDRGSINGVALDGLSVVAAVVGAAGLAVVGTGAAVGAGAAVVHAPRSMLRPASNGTVDRNTFSKRTPITTDIIASPSAARAGRERPRR